MVRRSLALSRSEARRLIESGRVSAGDDRSLKASTMVSSGTRLSVLGDGNVEFLLWCRKGAASRVLEVPS